MKDFNEKPTWFRPISDVGFHKIFCTEGNDELVFQLLNAVIDDRKIVGFTRLDPIFNASDYNHLSDKEQRQYEDSMTTVEDLMSYARVQRAEGVEEGMEKGRAEGKAEGKEEMAKAMKADGVPIETIARYSGLSESDIRAL